MRQCATHGCLWNWRCQDMKRTMSSSPPLSRSFSMAFEKKLHTAQKSPSTQNESLDKHPGSCNSLTLHTNVRSGEQIFQSTPLLEGAERSERNSTTQPPPWSFLVTPWFDLCDPWLSHTKLSTSVNPSSASRKMSNT